jgi:hypothetical protein
VGERTLTHYYNSTGIEIGPNIADPGAGNLDVRDHAVFDSDVTFSNRVTFNGQIIGNISATNGSFSSLIVAPGNYEGLYEGVFTPLGFGGAIWAGYNTNGSQNNATNYMIAGYTETGVGLTSVNAQTDLELGVGERTLTHYYNSTGIEIGPNIADPGAGNLDVRDHAVFDSDVTFSNTLTAVAVTANIAASTNAAGNSPLFSTNNSPFNAGGLTNLNAASLTGTLPMSTLPSVVITNNEVNDCIIFGAFSVGNTLTVGGGTILDDNGSHPIGTDGNGNMTVASISGNGSGLTSLNAASLVGIATNNTTGNASTATVASAVAGTLTNAVTNFSAVPGAGTNNNVLTWSGGQAAFAAPTGGSVTPASPHFWTNVQSTGMSFTTGSNLFYTNIWGTNATVFWFTSNNSSTFCRDGVYVIDGGVTIVFPISGYYSTAASNTCSFPLSTNAYFSVTNADGAVSGQFTNHVYLHAP